MKRAFRRSKKETLLKRRAKNYYQWSWSISINHGNQCWADYWKEVQAGETSVWMRHTGTVCSCWMCSGYNKYERPTAEVVRNIINEQLDDID